MTPPLPPLAAPVATALGAGVRAALLAAGDEIRECYRALERGGLNVVGEILRGQGEFVEYEHYPREEVGDADSRAQYYYHAHRDDTTEHGHFHAFIRTGLLDAPPAPYAAMHVDEAWPEGKEAIAHLVAIAMDDWGYPVGLFTTNRWVTGETWYPASTVKALVPRFAIDHANPSWPVNRWITAMLRLFRPHIDGLLAHRDAAIEVWQQAFPGRDAFADRRLEVIGYLPIDVEAWLAELRAASELRASIS
ncbi:DUF6969 family protein [Acidihalobacter prosperus]|uniref:DUF6969 domain-containing protein n=1 Tax=Acidihalobacter prosperus TaxID=160660 RepID=A0A1A6C1H8_9GAMM|nr:hypothetical protein [Acidihalobacter prosperus]OBS08400.1 hypothetical protein Thpro_022650 [Acidihalobacter prosperus]